MMLTSLAGRLLLGFFGLLPPNVALKLGRWLGRHFGMRLLRQKNFQRNFAIAFPDHPTAALVQEAAAHFGAVAAFYPHLRNLREGKRGASLELEGWEHVPEGSAIFIGAHVKFWEAGPLALERTGKRQLMIYSSLGVRWLADHLQAYREQGANVAFVEKADALRACLEHLKAGGSLGLLMDQRTDSGLDVDALKVVSEGVNTFRETSDAGTLLITHYTRILKYIKPDFVHVFVDGRIVESGGSELADVLEADGYERFTNASV